MTRVWGTALTVTGFIACPCHLPFTLPLLIGVLGGTGLGVGIAANVNLIYLFATVYFIAGVAVGLYLLNRKKNDIRAIDGRIPDQDGQVTET